MENNLPVSEWKEYLEPVWNDLDGLEYALSDLKQDRKIFDGSFPSDEKNAKELDFAIKETEERIKELKELR